MGKQIIRSSGEIERRICHLGVMKAMLSGELAALCGVEHKAMMQAVKRNIERFPDDFMFQLTAEEHASLESQL